MAPNLFLATQALFTPHRWFRRQKSDRPIRRTEHWEVPEPGAYEHIPGRGWYLVVPDSTRERLQRPRPVKYSKVLKRYMFQAEYSNRKRHGEYKDDSGKLKEAGFFRLDDEVSWVKCWDAHGEFLPGPYERWCIDVRTEKFRKMLKGDDPAWQSRSSRKSSSSNLDNESRSQSRAQDHQDSNSQPSTRPNSFRANASPQPSSCASSMRAAPPSQAKASSSTVLQTPPSDPALHGGPNSKGTTPFDATGDLTNAQAPVKKQPIPKQPVAEPVAGETTGT